MQTKLARVAVRTSLLYAVIAGLWILFSDRLLVSFVSDAAAMGRLSTYKGWFFVAVTASLLYFVLRGQLRRWEKEAASRIAAEETLLRAKREWEQTFDAVPDLIAILDDHHRILRVNRAMARRLGLTPEQCIGKVCHTVVHRLDHPPDFCPYALTQADGCEHVAEVREDVLGGDFIVSTAPLADEQGRCFGSVHIARDITERKRAEEALRESEKKYRQLVETTDTGYVIIDEHGRVADANPEYVRLTGRQRLEEVVGHQVLEWTAPHDRERNTLEVRRCLEQGSVRNLEIDYITPAGHFSPVEINAAVLPGAGSIQILSLCRDISERKRADKALRESEEHYRTLSEVTFEGITLSDQGVLIGANSQLARMLGYEIQEIIGRAVIEFVVPEDRELVRRNIEMNYELPYENRLFRQDGSIITVETQARHFFYQGRNIRVTALHDITERKRAEQALRASEERFRELYDDAPVGYHEFDSRGRIIDMNRTDLEMLGYEREEMIGRNVWDLGLEPERTRERVLEKLAGKRSPDKNLERIYARKDGTTFPALIEDRLVLDGRGEIKGIRSTIQDITERKRAEEEKAVLSNQLHQAQKMEAIGTLAGGIAHDFNNILSAILGYAELATLDLEEGSRARSNLDHSMKAANRAKDLVLQILAFSRQAKQERKPLQIVPIVKEGLRFLRATLPTTIEIRENIEKDLGTIEADPTQIHQVLMNLCTNAAHAMEEKGGVLEVSAGNLDLDETSAVSAGVGPGSYVRLRVSDTGHGMSPEIMKRIFDPYFTTKDAGKGTGLGLAVVHGIVTSHGGGIKVSSKPGEGSTFDTYFPVLTTVPSSSEDYRVEPFPVGLHERVLFVDDEEGIVGVGREILEYLGYEVVARTSSKEALELFRAESRRFDLVITDMTMPNMTGDKLAQELLRIRPDIPIILCTGFSEHITHEKAKTIGIREFVMKPIVMKELAKAIRRALDFRGDAEN